MKITKQHFGFVIKILGLIVLGFAIGWLIRDFGPMTLYYSVGIVIATVSVLVGLYLEK